MSYTIVVPRRHAVLYYAWEYGLRNVHRKLMTTPKAPGRKYLLALDVPMPIRTKAQALAAHRRVQSVVAWQLGRLGRPLNDDVWLERNGQPVT